MLTQALSAIKTVMLHVYKYLVIVYGNDTIVISYTNCKLICSILYTILGIQFVIEKSIHVCFSPKKGRSDMALYPKDMIVLKRYNNDI